MSVTSGPKLVKNGLIFYYDMNNTKKSLLGAPTTNLFGNNLSATNSSRLIAEGKFTGNYRGWETTGVTNDNPRTILYNGSIGVSANTFYTISCLYWSSNNAVDDVYLKFSDTGWTESTYYIQPFTSQSVTRNGSFSITDLGNGWKYCVGTFQTLATTTTLEQLFFDNDNAGVVVFITNIQLELGSIVTPYSSGTRSNTQTIRDLTRNTNLTASSLTYNANGTFSFNGSSNLIIAPENSIFNTQTPSVEVWIKTNALNQNGFWFEKGQVNTQYSLFQEGTNIVWRMNIGGITQLTAITASYISTSNWAQVVGTYTSGRRRLYINGVLVNSDAQTGDIATNANGISIGAYGGFNGSRGYYYNGNIGAVKIYNKELSADEVSQNFDAIRGQFSI